MSRVPIFASPVNKTEVFRDTDALNTQALRPGDLGSANNTDHAFQSPKDTKHSKELLRTIADSPGEFLFGYLDSKVEIPQDDQPFGHRERKTVRDDDLLSELFDTSDDEEAKHPISNDLNTHSGDKEKERAFRQNIPSGPGQSNGNTQTTLCQNTAHCFSKSV